MQRLGERESSGGGEEEGTIHLLEAPPAISLEAPKRPRLRVGLAVARSGNRIWRDEHFLPLKVLV